MQRNLLGNAFLRHVQIGTAQQHMQLHRGQHGAGQRSLTHAIAAQVSAGLEEAAADHTVELANLAQEGFDPRFTQADVALFQQQPAPPPDVAAEHARLDGADALLLVFPIYWCSFPALLKGRIDRMFTLGWAFDEGPDGKIVKKLQHLDVHMLAIGGADERTFAQHGYFGAMRRRSTTASSISAMRRFAPRSC